MRTKPLMLSAVCVGAVTTCFGLGIRLPDQDARATARGEAFAATADNPSAVYYNPAGISYLQGQNARVGLYSIYLNSDYKSPTGREFDTRDTLQGVPQFFYTYSPTNFPLSFGFGVYAPYGLALEWPDAVPFRTVAIDGEVLYASINPVVSWKIHDTLSVAAGPTINYSEATLSRGVAVPKDSFRFEGDDIELGFNAGLMWRPWEKHSFGVSYRSETTLDYKGDSRLRVPFALPFPRNQHASAELTFPQNIVAGYSFRPTPKWNLEVNVDWTDWNALNTVTLKQNPVTPLKFDWEASFFYEFGVTRYFENGFALSAGYVYSENSVPEGTFNPVVPDSDRHIFSLGVGRKYKKLSWDACYQFAWGPERSINNPASFPNASANGRYEYSNHAFSFSVGYTF